MFSSVLLIDCVFVIVFYSYVFVVTLLKAVARQSVSVCVII